MYEKEQSARTSNFGKNQNSNNFSLSPKKSENSYLFAIKNIFLYLFTLLSFDVGFGG